MQLRNYLAAAGLDPDTDVKYRVVPPAEYVSMLRVGSIDGFFGGEPGGQRAVFEGAGFIHLISKEIWDGHPCCSVTAAESWIKQNPNSFMAFYRAIIASSLHVAKRQLRLMEEYVQRFLQLGKPIEDFRTDVVNLSALIDDLLPLVQPAARHSGVDLQWEGAHAVHSEIIGDAGSLSQLVINLLLNAIEAASSARAKSNLPGRVVIALSEQSSSRIILSVSDSGCGPAQDVRDKLFEPFVTEKADGIGLGLSVAGDVAARHGGQLNWRRVDSMTEFTVDFPIVYAEVQFA
jgi:signal transduction histidine kinase